MAETLIKHGSQINKKDNNGLTALMYAAANAKNPKIIEVLLKNGADARIRSREKKTALDYAKSNPNLKETDTFWRINDGMYE